MKYISLTILIFLLLSCNNNEVSVQPPVNVIIDTDMGSDCDDVGALAILNEYANQGKANILGVIYSSGAVPYGAGVIDAINRYYGNDNIPIGTNYGNLVGDPVDKMQAEKLSKDTAAFKNRCIENTDVTEQTELLRKILSDETNENIVYITIGHTKGLYDLLVSRPDSISGLSGYELVNNKIEKWVALGALKANNSNGSYIKDWNFFYNGAAGYSKYLVDSFPKPIYFVNAGSNVMTGKSLIGTPNGNIVRTAYRDWLWNVEKKTLSDQRPSWDLMAVYFAVEDPTEYFSILDEGFLDFDPEKGCRWVLKDTVTNHNYVLQKQGCDNVLSDYLNNLMGKPNYLGN